MENLKELQEQLKGKMKKIAQKVDEELPKGFGFIVLAFPFGKNIENEMLYVSNSERADVILAMKEFIEKTENTYGNDTEKY